MKTIVTSILNTAIPYFFILLFIYAAVSKIVDLEHFQIQISESPLIGAYPKSISITVIILELTIAGTLCYPKTRTTGSIGSFFMMLIFTGYIFLIIRTSENLPCSCGGILEKLSWDQHLIFNIVCVLLAGTSLLSNSRYSRPAS